MTESPPLHPKSHRHANPFAERCRNNFPSLENAFSTPTKGDSGGSNSSSDDFQSVCSQGSSFLNMSIGAMAALTDHMRQVIKYGIDGEKTSELTEDTNTSRNSLDEKWNYLLDHSNVNTEGSFAAMFENATGVDLSFAGTDTSCDYFNTSRVKGLATPDRARDMQGMVSTREDEYYFDEEDEEHNDGDDGEGSHSSAFDPDHDYVHGMNRTLSFESLNNVDISRISNAGSEFLRKNNPEDSFQAPEDPFNFLNIASPGRFHDTSFTSYTPKRAPLAPRDTGPNLKNISCSSNCKRPLPPRMPTSRLDKENAKANCSFEKSNGIKKLSPTKAVPKPPEDLLRAIGGGEVGDNDPSPISFEQSTPSPESEKLESSLTGRRKYRTVVPRRVFLDSPHDFPAEQDSFCLFSQEKDEDHDDEDEDSCSDDDEDYSEDEEEYENEEEEILFSVKSLTESFEALFSEF